MAIFHKKHQAPASKLQRNTKAQDSNGAVDDFGEVAQKYGLRL
jgi:hypothetical protein